MFSLGVNHLIYRMFHLFFATVRKEHGDDVIAAMQIIMVLRLLTINESDDVLQSLFSILSANRKGDHGILSTKRNSAEKVIAQYKEKLKPFLGNEEQVDEKKFMADCLDGDGALTREDYLVELKDDSLVMHATTVDEIVH